MSTFQHLFDAIAHRSFEQRESPPDPSTNVSRVPGPRPSATPYIIDTTTISGALDAPFVDIRLLYRLVSFDAFPSLLTIKYMNAGARTRDQPHVEWKHETMDRNVGFHGFKHQTSLVIAVDQRSIDIKMFCNGKVNIVGALTMEQATCALTYIMAMLQSVYRVTQRPVVQLQFGPDMASEHVAFYTRQSNKNVRKFRRDLHARHEAWVDSTDTTDKEGHISCLRGDNGMNVSTTAERAMCQVAVASAVHDWQTVHQYCTAELAPDEPAPVVTIANLRMTNIHCVFSLQAHLDRYKLFAILKEQYGDECTVTFDPQSFPAVKWKHRTGGTAFLFQQGKVVMTGMGDESHVRRMHARIVEVVNAHWPEIALIQEPDTKKRKRA